MKFLLAICLLYLIANQIECTKVRGVMPERASLYDSSKPFSCLDGSNVIPFNQVNDDYCDCRDGSDEPGTSACMNSQFACENLGYVVQMIPSSRVNDKICDCCDGSDEYDSGITCENTCNALAAKMREEEEKLKILTEQGMAKRKELIEQGTLVKKQLQERLEELEKNKQNSEAERNKLEEFKNIAELKANEAKEKQDKIFEEKAKELEKLENLKKAKLLFDLLDLDKNLFITPEELIKRQELDILFDSDGTFTIEESLKLFDQNNQVSLEVFVTNYYEKISPHISLESEKNKSENEKVETSNEAVNLEATGEADTESSAEHSEQTEDNVNQSQTDSDKIIKPTENKYNEETQLLIDESEKAKTQFNDADKEFQEIEKDIEDIKKKIELDVGPNAEFASMIDKCFEYEDREYVYKHCPFDKTIQKSKSNSMETCIGYWSSWGEEPKKYTLMHYKNGVSCWNGPQRSTQVILSCGIETKIVSVTEPNKCEYEMKFETPAVCENISNSSEYHEEL